MDEEGNRSSAATIDHTEVHINVTKNLSKNGHSDHVISTGEPGVHYKNASNSETVSVPGQPTIVVQTVPDSKQKPKDFVVTSCFVIMLCNFVCGLLGWHYGLKANYAWQLGDENECRQNAKKAKIFVIVGILTGICTYVLALTLFFTLSPLAPGNS